MGCSGSTVAMKSSTSRRVDANSIKDSLMLHEWSWAQASAHEGDESEAEFDECQRGAVGTQVPLPQQVCHVVGKTQSQTDWPDEDSVTAIAAAADTHGSIPSAKPHLAQLAEAIPVAGPAMAAAGQSLAGVGQQIADKGHHIAGSALGSGVAMAKNIGSFVITDPADIHIDDLIRKNSVAVFYKIEGNSPRHVKAGASFDEEALRKRTGLENSLPLIFCDGEYVGGEDEVCLFEPDTNSNGSHAADLRSILRANSSRRKPSDKHVGFLHGESQNPNSFLPVDRKLPMLGINIQAPQLQMPLVPKMPRNVVRI
eukprot:gnl/TRDRNA2_/TRDRNA2_172875_c0_seq1.p1 gnl/TRDRNA2_/TRDRNA2_172875_c0~~gnl/TRDRNA2_/TRDRNA2_172875_c0_seq1.p1  ORF type:complete len:312 (+),score=47.29 gnl/TRDRNA2_/TRDRNA2_172875_c0_seq1:74-1009(+)